MNDASRLLDGELTQAELTTVLERLKRDTACVMKSRHSN